MNFFKKLLSFTNTKYFFFLVLVVYLLLYLFLNYDKGLEAVSSDAWMNNFVMIQQQEGQPWAYMPQVYSQQDLYIAFPLLYYISPGFINGVFGYHILGVLIITLTYVISGLVIKKIFNNWALASLGALLCVIPRFILPTRIGLLGLGNVRGNAFVYPLYLLLSYYWIIYGLQDRRKNIWLAVVAGLSVYLYPPVGTIIIALFVLTAFLVRGRKYFKEIFIFGVVYLLVAMPFLVNHFINPSTGMLDVTGELTAQDLSLQNEIIRYRFQANAFLTSIDLARIKRGIWDGFILGVSFVGSLVFYTKYRYKIREKYKLLFKTSIIFVILMLLFILAVEFVNHIANLDGKPPLFIEHLRLMRVVGFIMIMQFVFSIYLLYFKFNKQLLAIIISIAIVLTPLTFFASAIRPVIRIVVPESIRIKYNLAPVVQEEDVRSFDNLKDISDWTKDNVQAGKTKFFVFDDFQNEFKFKILSRHETNLTSKEGNIYVTSNFENSARWYDERLRYNEQVQGAEDFGQIVDFAKELECTHILLPRGELSILYKESESTGTSVLYFNDDYKVIKID
ncbi:hypothetical protein HOB10_03255 [Candidatus Parcubacteria bacterium]|jgi:hypothetical protein|nr:hypothetical protein [Candidatus Parcubacteria bacterium]